MTLTELAYKLRPYIEKAAKSLNDIDALESVELFPVWKPAAEYETGVRARYDGVPYRCLMSHESQLSWSPADAPSLWAKVLIPDENVIPAWEQPDSTNSYMAGDKVTHGGKTWTSTISNNVWEPGAYGWEES